MYQIRLSIAILILILAVIGAAGVFYPLPFFDIQIIPLVQRVIVDFSVIGIVILSVIFLLTLLTGRIYCSLLCPFGILQELIALFRGNNNEEKRLNLPVKYFIAAVAFGVLIGGSTLFIRYIEPYTFFSSAVTLSIIGICAVIAVILITIFKNRFFCTNICPVGCILGLLSKISLFKIFVEKDNCISCRMCERNCPSGCINIDEENIENETCIKCLKCLGKCPKNAIKYGIKPKEKTAFSPKRRELIKAGAALIVLLGAIKAGIEIGQTAAKKIKNVILPPGAVDANRMFNKCLNCNLCINACPNKIITKANKDFGAVHIDYNQGKMHCKYDCSDCSKVCPSGAIKKISLEEKQKTRIAMAVVNTEKCNKCIMQPQISCIEACPVHAITMEDTAKIDASKCIGCNKCKLFCLEEAIEIFAINEQQSV